MRKYGIIVGAAVTAACALAIPSLLYTQSLGTFGPLPPPVPPPDLVPLTPLESLGKQLLYDSTLSDPPGYACATCHIPSTGLTSGPDSIVNLTAGPQTGVVVGRIGKRRPQSYAYAAFSPEGPYFDRTFAQAYVGGAFWDGRTPDLTAQARMPFLDPNEMANIPTNGIFPPVAGGFSALVAQKAVANWRGLFQMDQRAIACFDQALEDVGLARDERLRRVLHDYFAWATTTTMSRYQRSAEDVPDGLPIPKWSWRGLVSETEPAPIVPRKGQS